MSVYVDDMYAGYGRMKMCHMMADSRTELDEMADKIGVQRKWIQREGTYREHYDVCMAKRTLAIQNGAIEIGWRDVAEKLKVRREKIHVVQHSMDCDECRAALAHPSQSVSTTAE